MKDEDKLKSPIDRRDFLRTCGSLLAGGMALASGGLLAAKASGKDGDVFWQIDPYKCTQCGRCETDCVLTVSAVKCFHANRVCGYCDLCGGYYRPNVKDLNTAAENLQVLSVASLWRNLILSIRLTKNSAQVVANV